MWWKYNFYLLGKDVSNALVYSNSHPNGQLWCHVKGYYLYFANPGLRGRKVVHMGQLRGDNSVPTFQICYYVELAFRSFTLASN